MARPLYTDEVSDSGRAGRLTSPSRAHGSLASSDHNGCNPLPRHGSGPVASAFMARCTATTLRNLAALVRQPAQNGLWRWLNRKAVTACWVVMPTHHTPIGASPVVAARRCPSEAGARVHSAASFRDVRTLCFILAGRSCRSAVPNGEPDAQRGAVLECRADAIRDGGSQASRDARASS